MRLLTHNQLICVVKGCINNFPLKLVPKKVEQVTLVPCLLGCHLRLFVSYSSYEPTYLPTYLPSYLPTYLPTYLPPCLLFISKMTDFQPFLPPSLPHPILYPIHPYISIPLSFANALFPKTVFWLYQHDSVLCMPLRFCGGRALSVCSTGSIRLQPGICGQCDVESGLPCFISCRLAGCKDPDYVSLVGRPPLVVV